MLALLYEIMNSCFGSSKRTGALQEFAGRLAVMFSAISGRTPMLSDSICESIEYDEQYAD